MSIVTVSQLCSTDGVVILHQEEQLPMGAYVLEELDGTILKRPYASSHVKRFYSRGTREEEEGSDEEEEEQEAQGEGCRGLDCCSIGVYVVYHEQSNIPLTRPSLFL